MTPEQVSALSDNELNRAIIWLYPPKTILTDYKNCLPVMACEDDPECCEEIDCLSDYNLTMPLVERFRITMRPARSTPNCWFAYDTFRSALMCKNYLRAACECLVLIALADK